jgi:hypothetical protein
MSLAFPVTISYCILSPPYSAGCHGYGNSRRLYTTLARVLLAISVLGSRLILQPLSECSESQQSAALSHSATHSTLVRPLKLLNFQVLYGSISQYFWRRSSYRSTRFFILISPEGHKLLCFRRTVAGQSPWTSLNLLKSYVILEIGYR